MNAISEFVSFVANGERYINKLVKGASVASPMESITHPFENIP